MSLLSHFALLHCTGNYLLIDDGLTRAFRAVLTAHQTALSPPRCSNPSRHPPHPGHPYRPRLRRPPHRTHAIITSLSQRSAFHASSRTEHWPSAAARPLCTLHNSINTWLHVDLLAAARPPATSAPHHLLRNSPPFCGLLASALKAEFHERSIAVATACGGWEGAASPGEIWRTCRRASGERCLRGRRRR